MATLSRLAELPVTNVKDIGPGTAAKLGKAGIFTVADLLNHIPRTYVDRTQTPALVNVPLGAEVTVIGEVRSVKSRRPRRNLVITEVRVADETASIKVVFFNQSYLEARLPPGTPVAVSGTVESFRGSLQMSHPDLEVLGGGRDRLKTGRVMAVHPQVGGVNPNKMREFINNAVKRSRPISDPIPDVALAKHGLMSRDEAYAYIHFPETGDQVDPARTRLAFDELFRLSLALALRKRRQQDEATGIAHTSVGDLTGRFLSGLPFRLTAAQESVLAEIVRDLAEPHPMHRLLQGEVGSGKTVVAVATLLHGIEGGWQGAIMAPTEVLAVQHYLSVVHLLNDAGLSPSPFSQVSDLGMESLFGSDGPAIHVAILTGSTAAANYRPDITRRALIDDIASGQVDLVVGTHALIQEGVHFARLGVAVVDEQHRFGVAQRVMLREKAAQHDPDLLIMTATPIPRTLALTFYGDLDVSEIKEMPPGRAPVRTVLLGSGEEDRAWQAVRDEVGKGRQAFVVCPLVTDSEKVEAASAIAEHERLTSLLPGLTVGLIHGQLRPVDKEQVMSAFRAGEIHVLVSTTVIEVGVDVPNATLMVIEDADRFGLSQLHQLRGRVGRGAHPGTCILIADPGTPESTERLKAMVSTTDGFRLAEVDLEIRGQGTTFGERQAGLGDFRVANPLRDLELLKAARAEAFALVDDDPSLTAHPDLLDEVKAMLGDAVEWLFAG